MNSKQEHLVTETKRLTRNKNTFSVSENSLRNKHKHVKNDVQVAQLKRQNEQLGADWSVFFCESLDVLCLLIHSLVFLFVCFFACFVLWLIYFCMLLLKKVFADIFDRTSAQDWRLWIRGDAVKTWFLGEGVCMNDNFTVTSVIPSGLNGLKHESFWFFAGFCQIQCFFSLLFLSLSTCQTARRICQPIGWICALEMMLRADLLRPAS